MNARLCKCLNPQTPQKSTLPHPNIVVSSAGFKPNDVKISQASALSQKKGSIQLLAHFITVAQKTNVHQRLDPRSPNSQHAALQPPEDTHSSLLWPDVVVLLPQSRYTWQ